jgi:coenzyme Q-binding protein COQ10
VRRAFIFASRGPDLRACSRYTRQQLYELVADVGSYPLFVPFCTGSRILCCFEADERSRGDQRATALEAELTVGFLSFSESYISKVTRIPFESVEVCIPFPNILHGVEMCPKAVASSSTHLFKTLETVWRFQRVPPTSPHPPSSDPSTGQDTCPTLVTLDLKFAFASPVHAAVSATFFGQVSRLMVRAFEERCLEVYGRGRQ